jgi:hypothetical protein
MPLKKPTSKSKKNIQAEVSSNIRELKQSKTKRPMKQIVAIAPAISWSKKEVICQFAR